MHTATVYCKPWIAHWLIRHYGNPVRFPRGCDIRSTFLSCISKDFHPHTSFNKTLYPVRVDIQMNKDLVSEIGHTLSVSHQHIFNDVVSEQVGAEIFLFVEAHGQRGIKPKQAIIKYQKQLNVTDDIFPLETIRTKYNRYKRKLNKIFLTSDTTRP